MATLAERLVEAESAYHDLLTGKGVRAFTDQNGERVEYSAANPSKLLAYIAWLKAQIAAAAGYATEITGPMRSYFI
jgi:hypothetical protein